jgi:hypothetical protein
MPIGTATLTASSKTRSQVAVTSDELGLARLTIGGIDSPLELSMTLSADQLYDLIAQANKALEHLFETDGIGVETLGKRHSSEIDRLAHAIAPQAPRARKVTPLAPGTPPADLPAHELRRLAIAEVAKVRAAKARGDYK